MLLVSWQGLWPSKPRSCWLINVFSPWSLVIRPVHPDRYNERLVYPPVSYRALFDRFPPILPVAPWGMQGKIALTKRTAFEQACQQRGIRLFVLPLRSPKCILSLPKGSILPWKDVERAQRTHAEEFYEVVDFSLEVAALNQELLAWEHTYNTIRPHQSFSRRTRPWPTLHLTNSSLNGNTKERRPCVTNHLDEYMNLTLYQARNTLAWF